MKSTKPDKYAIQLDRSEVARWVKKRNYENRVSRRVVGWVVNIVTDLLSLLAAWGPNPDYVADINNDDTVNATDLLALLAAWGACP